jgi:peptidoglycan hydrolase-like protein with peptidoglycan-binding domain
VGATVEPSTPATRRRYAAPVATAARFQGLAAFDQCLAGARITTGGFDADGDQQVDGPNDVDTVRAIQQALLDLGFPVGTADGDYGGGTAEAVRQFKVAQDLPLPAGLAEHDGVTGPGTATRLDELFADSAVVRLTDQYGVPLAGVSMAVEGGAPLRLLTTNQDGAAVVDLGPPWSITLDTDSTLAAVGSLLDRPWPPDPPPAGTLVTTALTDVPVLLGPGDDLTVLVATRASLQMDLATTLTGAVEISGNGVDLAFDETLVFATFQANGGAPVDVDVAPFDAGPLPPLPDLPGWVLPDGYVVREGDTAASLGELFLGDPARFAELSDHDPVAGETLTLPAAAVPSWLALATEPPPETGVVPWFTVRPDDVLRALCADDADPQPWHFVVGVLDRPPSPGEDPAAVMAARFEVLAALLAAPEVVGPSPEVPVEDQG